MLNNKKGEAIKSHIELFRTYKELKTMLPFGYIKMRVSPGQKYSFKKQPLLINLEKEKNKEISPTKITKNLLYNKNIYFFSNESKKAKKLISSLKRYNSYNKSKYVSSIKNESIISNNKQNNSEISKNKSKINSYILNSNTINFNNINTKNSYKSILNENEESEFYLNGNLCKNQSEFLANNNYNYFRGSSINNCEMKNNIYLPSITNRLKNPYQGIKGKMKVFY